MHRTLATMLFFMSVVFHAHAGPRHTMRTSYYNCEQPGECSKSKRTANGEKFNKRALTAAHKTLPFGTKLHLRNPKNGKHITVRINDRGPFVRGRDLDVSEGAARALGFKGVVRLYADITR